MKWTLDYNNDVLPIITSVELEHGVSLSQIRSKTRKVPVVKARHDLCCRLRGELKISYPNIGRIINRDHSTVYIAVKKRRNERSINA